MTAQEQPVTAQVLFGLIVEGPGKRGLVETFRADAEEQPTLEDALAIVEPIITGMMFGTDYDRDDFTATPLWIDVVTLPELETRP